MNINENQQLAEEMLIDDLADLPQQNADNGNCEDPTGRRPQVYADYLADMPRRQSSRTEFATTTTPGQPGSTTPCRKDPWDSLPTSAAQWWRQPKPKWQADVSYLANYADRMYHGYDDLTSSNPTPRTRTMDTNPTTAQQVIDQHAQRTWTRTTDAWAATKPPGDDAHFSGSEAQRTRRQPATWPPRPAESTWQRLPQPTRTTSHDCLCEGSPRGATVSCPTRPVNPTRPRPPGP